MNSDNPQDDNKTIGGVTSSVVPPATQQLAKDDLAQAKDKAQQDLAAVKQTAQEELDAIKQRAAAEVRGLTDQAKEQIGAGVEHARSFATEQKDFAAGQLTGIASAINKVADELSNGDQAMVGRYARDLAGGIERFAGNVRDKSPDDLMNMAQQFGRSQPLAFLGVAALAGFMASRFALASSHRQSVSGSPTTGNGTSYGAGSYGSGTYRDSTGSSYGVGSTGTTGATGGSGYGTSSTGSGTGLGSSSYAGTSGTGGTSRGGSSVSPTGSGTATSSTYGTSSTGGNNG
jgi:hypothetical protein